MQVIMGFIPECILIIHIVCMQPGFALKGIIGHEYIYSDKQSESIMVLY